MTYREGHILCVLLKVQLYLLQSISIELLCEAGDEEEQQGGVDASGYDELEHQRWLPIG